MRRAGRGSAARGAAQAEVPELLPCIPDQTLVSQNANGQRPRKTTRHEPPPSRPGPGGERLEFGGVARPPPSRPGGGRGIGLEK